MDANAADEKRTRISDAAVKIFARKGYHGTRIADIAREAGVSYGLVYHYFRSKEEIVHFLFQRKWDLLVHVLENIRAEERPFPQQIEAISDFLIETYRMNPELIESLVMEITRNAKFIRGTNLQLLERALSGFEELIEKAQESGEVDGSIDARMTAYAYFGAVESVLTGFVFRTFTHDEETFARAKRGISDLFVRGLAPTAGG